jgi:DNA-directed RNA polymerase specialized sigma24 family protein
LGSRRTRRDRYLELWRRAGADAARLAFLLDPDPEAARAIAERSFGRCIARMQDRRSTDLIDVWFRRDVVRLVARRSRISRLRRRLKSQAPRVPDLPGVPPAGRDLWRAFMLLPLKQRAAIVLDHFEHMPRAHSADALGRSIAGTNSLIAHGWAGLEERIGAKPDETELQRLLTLAAEQFEAAPVTSGQVGKLARRARRVSAAVAICLAGGAVGGGMVASSVLSTSRDAQESRPSGAVDDEDSEQRSTIGLGFRGSPGWCPDPRRALRINEVTGRDATRTAIRVAIAINKGFADDLAHLIEVPAGAPPARRWPAPAAAARLSVVDRGLGGLNDSLAIECGVQVADRTWIVIIEDRVPPADDGVAFYVVMRPTGFKVWGSFGAFAR